VIPKKIDKGICNLILKDLRVKYSLEDGYYCATFNPKPSFSKWFLPFEKDFDELLLKMV